ncbi:3725_t:CDS:2, partial [Cetraspora pellucida]
INSERRRYNFEEYWNDVILGCKIKRDILNIKAEIEHIQSMLSDANDKLKMKEDEFAGNSSKWKEGSVNEDNFLDGGDVLDGGDILDG